MDSAPAVDGIDFGSVPAKALNISSRLQLSWFLNPEQPLLCTNLGIARDYRGLAELMGFEYNDIKNFQRSEDPTAKILEAWEAKPKTTIADLLEMLEKMGRHDIIEDLLTRFENDAMAFTRRNLKLRENPIQVSEVTSCRSPESYFEENPNILTLGDAMIGDITYYDAYVCYADEDHNFVYELATHLESPRIGLKLCIRGRDLLIGTSETDAHIKLIRERCQRMIIILSPHFLKSPACEFHASFAAGLAIEQRQRKLIPIVLAPCEIPSILKFVSKIDFCKPDIHQWVWDKLIASIRGAPASMFVSSSAAAILPEKYLPPQLEPCNSNFNNPVITFPPSINVSLAPTSSALVVMNSPPSTASTSSAIPIMDSSLNDPASVMIPSKTTPPTKQRWYQNLKDKFARNTSVSSSSASSATSGFHSRSDVFDSMEMATDGCTNSTPL